MFKVSVVTTLYNYKDYIVDCIESFVKQDFKNSEMIIVDDNSTDNPYPNIKKHLSARVKYIKLDKNRGYSKTLGKIIEVIQGQVKIRDISAKLNALKQT